MTIPSTPRKAGPFLGNGATTSFPFAFKVFGPTDIKVVVANSAGVETTLVLNSDYAVTLNPNQDTSPGGVVTYPLSGSLLPPGSTLSIIGDIDYDQPLDLPSGGNFSPLALENQLDRTTMQIQQLAEIVGRSLSLPVTSNASTQLPAPEADKFLAWNSTGTALINADAASGSIDGPFLLLDNVISSNFAIPPGKNALSISPTIAPGVTVAVAPGSEWVVLDSSIGGGGGEANTASNVGTGQGKLFKAKIGVDLQFKSIKAGSNITITNNTDDITISASGVGNDGEVGPVSGYIELPSSIGSSANGGIPNRGATTLKVQYGTAASPATGNNERAISSQAVVNASYPWSSPSHWSPNEFSVINQGLGRVNALNSVLVTSTDLQMDNTAIYSYAKNNYAGGKTGLGGVVGLWSIVDTRGSPTRGVGAEFVLLHDFADRYDYNPKSLLSENANDTTNGAFHAGVRISTLLSSKIVARGLDIITGSPNAGFDTGINIQAFRSRALYIHNNLGPGVGGNRVGIEFADTVDNAMLWITKDGNQYIFKQDYSASKGYYYNFRKDANNNWLGMYSDGTVTLSGSTSTGTKLTVRPDGTIIAGHTTATNAGFAVPAGGFFWLNHQKTSYITQSGSNIILVKDGAVVATW